MCQSPGEPVAKTLTLATLFGSPQHSPLTQKLLSQTSLTSRTLTRDALVAGEDNRSCRVRCAREDVTRFRRGTGDLLAKFPRAGNTGAYFSGVRNCGQLGRSPSSGPSGNQSRRARALAVGAFAGAVDTAKLVEKLDSVNGRIFIFEEVRSFFWEHFCGTESDFQCYTLQPQLRCFI